MRWCPASNSRGASFFGVIHERRRAQTRGSMKCVFRFALVAAVVVLGWWGWRTLFPNPRLVIRHRLESLATLASFSPGEGRLARLAAVQKIGGYFSENVQIRLNAPGTDLRSIENREDLLQAAAAAAGSAKNVKVRFLDENIQLLPGNQEAVVDLAVRADVGDDKDTVAEGLKISMKKIKGAWVLTRVEPEN